MSEPIQFEIVGLSRRDKANLLEHIPKELVRFDSAPVKPGELGDPTALVAIVCLTAVSLSGIFAWLARQGIAVKASGTIKIPGNEAGFKVELGPKSTEKELRAQLEHHGLKVG